MEDSIDNKNTDGKEISASCSKAHINETNKENSDQSPDDQMAENIINPESFNLTYESDKAISQRYLRNSELDEIIYNALKKVKEYFFNNEIEEQKLAEFMFKILTLNLNDMTAGKSVALNTEILDRLVDQMFESDQKTDLNTYGIIENMFGRDTAQVIFQKLGSEKVDEIIERLLGKDTKKMICDKLESENLDELLNQLIDEKFKFDNDPEAKHPNFDEFIEKILGKDTEEFIKQKLENFVQQISVDIEDTSAVKN